MLLATGLGALPVLGTGLLLLVPWLLAMQAAVRIERRRAVAVHGISVIVPARRRSRRTGFPGWLHDLRSEERRVGKEWRSRQATDPGKKTKSRNAREQRGRK